MNNKLKRFSIVFVFFIASILFSSLDYLGICDLHNDICGDIFMEMFGQSFGFFSLIILIGFIFLSFMKEEVYERWWKFAKKYLIISAILIVITPSTSSGMLGGLGAGGGYDREGMIWFLAGLFFVISVILIPVKAWQLRDTSSKK